MRPATRSGCGWGWAVTEVSGEERLARAALTCVAEPGDPVMGALLRTCAPAEIVTALVRGRVPVPAAGPAGPGRHRPQGPDHDRPRRLDHDRPQGLDQDRPQGLDQDRPQRPDWDGLPGLDRAPPPGLDRARLPGLDRALSRWAGRLGEVPAEPDLDTWRQAGIRLVCPGDPEWPSQLEVLGDARPCGLWVRGSGDLRYACLRSVSVVGTRSATAYGSHVCTEMAATLAERGWTVVSGGPPRALPRHPRGGSDRQRMAAWPHAHPPRVPGPQPGDRRSQPRHRRGGGSAAQRRAEHRPPRARPGPPAHGRAGAGDFDAVGRLSRDHPRLGCCLRHRCVGRDGGPLVPRRRTAGPRPWPGAASARSRRLASSSAVTVAGGYAGEPGDTPVNEARAARAAPPGAAHWVHGGARAGTSAAAGAGACAAG